mmetsp:Transcript_67340/g.219361  ORF Transcript_67340/g.219361 Transcript_67340/m.219361 type:complete len:82 (-) Transcript_67340:72-317(-)
MERLGAEENDAWQSYHFPSQLNWGKMKGVRCAHFQISHSLTMSLRGAQESSQASLCHLPKKDPIHREKGDKKGSQGGGRDQ